MLMPTTRARKNQMLPTTPKPRYKLFLRARSLLLRSSSLFASLTWPLSCSTTSPPAVGVEKQMTLRVYNAMISMVWQKLDSVRTQEIYQPTTVLQDRKAMVSLSLFTSVHTAITHDRAAPTSEMCLMAPNCNVNIITGCFRRLDLERRSKNLGVQTTP